MRTKAVKNAESEIWSLIRISDSSELPKGTPHRHLLYFSGAAADALNVAIDTNAVAGTPDIALNDGVQPLYVFADKYEVLIGVYPNRGTSFKVVVAGRDGNPIFLAEARRKPVEVSSLNEGKKAVERLNEKLIGATLLFNTGFLEQNERMHMEIGTGDAHKLGVKKFEKGYYRVAVNGAGFKDSKRAR